MSIYRVSGCCQIVPCSEIDLYHHSQHANAFSPQHNCFITLLNLVWWKRGNLIIVLIGISLSCDIKHLFNMFEVLYFLSMSMSFVCFSVESLSYWFVSALNIVRKANSCDLCWLHFLFHFDICQKRIVLFLITGFQQLFNCHIHANIFLR